MTTTQQRERVRFGGRIERAQPGTRQTTPSGIEYDHRFIASTELLATASLDAQEGLRERTEAGHIAAGRVPPSQESSERRAGADFSPENLGL